MFENTDDGLKKRIRRGLASVAVGGAATTAADRPKTPKNTTRKMVKSKPKKQSSGDDDGCSENDSNGDDNVKEITNSVKRVTLTAKEILEPPINVMYLCPSCDKTYKSKSGIIKHMGLCKPLQSEKKKSK